MRHIEHVLVVSVAVDRGERPLFDAEPLVQHLHHGRQAVGGTGGVREHVVPGRVIHMIVDAEHDRDIAVGRWRGDEDLLHAATQMRLRPGRIGEPAGGFDHHLDVERWPIDLGGLPRRKDLGSLGANADGIAIGLHLLGAGAERGIVFQQMRQGLRVH